jgi:hypothetical protein
VPAFAALDTLGTHVHKKLCPIRKDGVVPLKGRPEGTSDEKREARSGTDPGLAPGAQYPLQWGAGYVDEFLHSPFRDSPLKRISTPTLPQHL